MKTFHNRSLRYIISLLLLVILSLTTKSYPSSSSEGYQKSIPKMKMITYNLSSYLPMKKGSPEYLSNYKLIIYVTPEGEKYDLISGNNLIASMIFKDGKEIFIDHLSKRYTEIKTQSTLARTILRAERSGKGKASTFDLGESKVSISSFRLREVYSRVTPLARLRKKAISVTITGKIDKTEDKSPLIWGNFALQGEYTCEQGLIPDFSYEKAVGYLLLLGANSEALEKVKAGKLPKEYRKHFLILRVVSSATPSSIAAYAEARLEKERGENCHLTYFLFQAPLHKDSYKYLKSLLNFKGLPLGVISTYTILLDVKEMPFKERILQAPESYQKV